MRLPHVVVEYLKKKYLPIPDQRPLPQGRWNAESPRLLTADEIVGPGMRWRKIRADGDLPEKPFLYRWFIPGYKSKYLNRYLHCFCRDDEDRALHDHPWFNLSILLDGSYIEHTIDKGGVHRRTVFTAGDVKWRSPWAAHRVELLKDENGNPRPAWSLFLTGPVMRKQWGFHCPETGWRSSHDFHINGGCD
jgi:hypothetical protein